MNELQQKLFAIEMASKLWIYGKKLTIWGALLSSLPFMFVPLMLLSAFGVAVSIPLGCAVGGYVCFRKCLRGLSRKRLIGCEREKSGVKKNEAEAAGHGVYLDGSDVDEEYGKIKSELVGHSQVQFEELGYEGGEEVDGNDHRGEPLIYAGGYEGKIPEVKPIEEEVHGLKTYEEPHHLIKLCKGEIPLKWDSHDLTSVGGPTPAGENHSMQNDKVEVRGGVDQLTGDPDVNISVAQRIPEDGSQSKQIDEGKASEGETHLTLNPQVIPIEKTATIEHIPKDKIHFSQEEEIKASERDTQLARDPDHRVSVEEYSLEDETQSMPHAVPMEEQTSKDEAKYNLKEEAKASNDETQLTSDHHHALSVEKISSTDTKLRRKEKEEGEEESNEMQDFPTSESRHEQAAELDLQKFSSTDTKHKKRELEEGKKGKQSIEIHKSPSKKFHHEHGGELDSRKLKGEKEDKQSGEIREIPSKKLHHEHGGKSDSGKLSRRAMKRRRRKHDVERRKEGEESSKMQEVPSKRYNHEDGRELASEKLSPRDGKHRGREEDEEEGKKGENSNETQESSDRSSNAKGAEPDVGKLFSSDTRHKKREEKEEEVLESDKVQEVLSKMYPREQQREVELAPSCDNAIRGGNPASSEPRHYSDALSIQAVSPHGVSLPGSEYNAASRENDVTDIETTLSLEVQVSSASGSDKDSKSVLESSIELDSDESDSDEKIWEEIHAVRKIVGYKEEPHPSYAEEIKALYVFTGVEPPASLENSSDLVKVKEKLKFLKVVVGVK